MPWKASLPLPGIYGYAATKANSQITALMSWPVGRAVVSSSHPVCTRPAWTWLKNRLVSLTTTRAIAKMSTTNNNPGIAPSMLEPKLTSAWIRLSNNASPQGRV